MVVNILENRARHRDYRSTYKLIARLLAYDSTAAAPPKVRLTTPFSTLLAQAFRTLIVEGRHLGAQALFEEFKLPLETIESGVLEHLQSYGGCYYPGGVYMVNWSVGIHGVSEEFREACAVEITKGILRPRVNGKARGALEMCFLRVTGFAWSEEEIPPELRGEGGVAVVQAVGLSGVAGPRQTEGLLRLSFSNALCQSAAKP
ncbi:hypothetical protein HDU67_006810 [Dinochytrium kinnereticum]|nr:hypothetical protein HDU67_006810 [Dinochytrium kinnereticum]